ncbi:serine hydrolase [Streptomyces sp. NPDC008141]|uniref:serine hydrolase n=1 Tax=Streptomyces sp. NPDC008141 TaxID=3364815 RepID=UPI0036EBC639
MTHGGGTVAGESPDKSEQRKSSGETTSGERDPRLAVFRQASAPAPAVDQPTAVFKMPEASEPDPVSPDPVRAETVRAEPGTESGSAENDARLRAAVAAWVASTDEEPAKSGVQSDAESDSGSGGDSASGSSADAESDSEPESVAQTSELPEPAATAELPVTPDEVEPEEPAADEPEDAPAAASEPDTAEDDRSEEAAEPAARDEEPASDADADAPEPADQPEPADTPAAVVAEDAVPVEDTTEAETPQGAEPATADDSVAEADADAVDDADADAEVPRSSGAAAADAPAETSTPEPPADRTDGDTGKDAEADKGTDIGKDPAGSTASDGSSTAKADVTPAKEDAAPAKEDAAPAEPAVDQPTAVFKAPRKPPVDSPTTALKMPPAPRPEAAPAPAERTSTFVPLRVDDGVRTPTAKRAEAIAPAAPAKPPAAPDKPAAPAKPAAAAPASAAAPESLTEAERTRQQPMPPLPPLDLLAELTNTPPPPQTAVRTVFRRFKIWTPLVVLLLIVFAIAQAVRPLPEPELALSVDPTYTFQGGKLSLPFPGEGQGAVEVEGVGTIGTYGAQKPAPIASVAKTMTAYVILKNHPITGEEVGPTITVDQQAEDEGRNEDESTAKVTQGQQFTERQMLQLLMIPSGNNAARLLARWDAKTEAEFVKKMNDAAKELGMTNSTYTDPSGLKATTVSTPLDQLKLAKAVMQNDIFREIVDTPMTTIPGIQGSIRNNNDEALLKDGVGGIKTGSSTPAGGNLLWAANTRVDGKIRRIVGITMGVQNAQILNSKLELAIDHSIKVIEAAQSGVTSATVVKKGAVVGYVDDGFGGRTAVVATKDLKAVGWGGLEIKIAINDAGKSLPHTASAGDIVGQVSVGSGTGKVTAPVALQKDLAEPGFGDKLTRIG